MAVMGVEGPRTYRYGKTCFASSAAQGRTSSQTLVWRHWEAGILYMAFPWLQWTMAFTFWFFFVLTSYAYVIIKVLTAVSTVHCISLICQRRRIRFSKCNQPPMDLGRIKYSQLCKCEKRLLHHSIPRVRAESTWLHASLVTKCNKV